MQTKKKQHCIVLNRKVRTKKNIHTRVNPSATHVAHAPSNKRLFYTKWPIELFGITTIELYKEQLKSEEDQDQTKPASIYSHLVL